MSLRVGESALAAASQAMKHCGVSIESFAHSCAELRACYARVSSALAPSPRNNQEDTLAQAFPDRPVFTAWLKLKIVARMKFRSIAYNLGICTQCYERPHYGEWCCRFCQNDLENGDNR